jgi:hypothetical protein
LSLYFTLKGDTHEVHNYIIGFNWKINKSMLNHGYLCI